MERSERNNRCHKTTLNMQKSAEAIVADFSFSEGLNQ